MSWDSLPSHLRRMGQLLQGFDSTKRTSEHLMELYGRFQETWSKTGRIEAKDVALPPPRDKKLQPRNCEIQNAYLSFTFESRENELFPRLADYQVRIEGMLVTGDALIELQDHWRVDTDRFAREPAEGSGNRLPGDAKEAHPFYHFQRGGHDLDEFAGLPNFYPGPIPDLDSRDWRGLLQYPGPRIPSLPMDPILAVDFCIAQHDGTVWWQLRDTPEYLQLVREAQERLWCPFIEAMADRTHRRKWLGPMALA
jgi:hypothetical protein